MSDTAIEEWTTRLVGIAPELDRSAAHDFVQALYESARRDLDEERREADYERDE